MHRSRLLIWILGLNATAGWGDQPMLAADPQAMIQVLEERSCEGCKLRDADLVQADLREARLKGASLQRANLSGALLDGADLRNADLSFSSLTGASLRGTNLRGAVLIGTDLRGSDLSGAQLDPGSLSRSHWQQARGIPAEHHNYAELHNAGIRAALAGQHPEAEHWLSNAIQQMPDAAISWVARGLNRLELGRAEDAANDFHRASQLYAAAGDGAESAALNQASNQLLAPPKKTRQGNGLGSRIISGLMTTITTLGPLALKAMAPTPF